MAAAEQRAEEAAVVVLAHPAEEVGAGAERGEVEGDVRRAAGDGGLAVDAHDGDGRLGREARGVAPHVLVEHDVADHEDALLRDGFEDGGEIHGARF